MRFFRFIVCLMTILLSGIGFAQNGQSLQFEIDLITHLNTAAQVLEDQNTLFAATSGGLLTIDPTSQTYQTFTAANGIFDHNLTAIAKSSRGLLLLGSGSGNLAIMNPDDGSIANDQNLAGNAIVDMVSVADTLWVLCQSFVSVYLYDSGFGRYQFRESYQEYGQPIGDFTAVGYGGGRIWLANEDGLVSAPSDFIRNNLYAGENWRVDNAQTGFSLNQFDDLTMAPDGSALYMSGPGFTLRYQFGDATPSVVQTSGYSRVHFIDQTLYVSNAFDVFRFSGTQSERVYHSTYGRIRDFAIMPDGEIWVAREKRGIVSARTGNTILVDGPLDNYVGEIALDARGRIWAVAGLVKDERQQGIFVFDGDSWRNFKTFGGPSNSYTYSNSSLALYEDPAGNMWVGAWGGGTLIFDADLNITPLNTLANAGSVWRFGTQINDTIAIQTPTELLNILSPVTVNPNYSLVTDIYPDPSRQSIWLLNSASDNQRSLLQYTSSQFGPEAYQPSSWIAHLNPLGKREWFEMAIDVFGDFWLLIGTANGEGVIQTRMIDGSFVDVPNLYTESEDNLKSNAVRSVAADNDGYVWVGTASGLSGILNGTVFDFRGTYQPIGLLINDIFVDDRGNKWFATDKGISILKGTGSPFDPASWIDIVPENSTIDAEQRADRSNLFIANLPSEKIHSIFLDNRTGDVYAGTDAGIAVIRHNPFATTFTDYQQMRLGPNPFMLQEGENRKLNILNLVGGSQVKILTVSGELVRQLSGQNFEEIQGGQAQWDGRNTDGELVASGVYLILVTNEEGESHGAGKVMVIRQ